MNLYRIIIAVFILSVSTLCSPAQESVATYKDSISEAATKNPPTSKPEADNEVAENDDDDDDRPDTLLLNNHLSVERDSIQKLKSSRPFAYAKNLDSMLLVYQQKMETEEGNSKNESSWLARFFMSPVTKYFFWALAVFFVGFILYQLFFTEGFFQRNYARSYVTPIAHESENLTMNTDFNPLITQAIADKNFRMAVRYHYLQALQKLYVKGAIQYAADKTNYEYLDELSGKPYKQAFASLTLHYEYVWYGEAAIDENIYTNIQNRFTRFNSEVKQ